MAVIIQLRHDTASNWITNNPILADGEAGIETDTNRIKIGNGEARWSSLAYFGGSVQSVNGKTGEVILDATDVGALPDSTVIPTVNNGTLTIQVNGTNVQTFSANASSNVTANIEAIQPDDVINNTSSSDTDKPLSAAMGLSLQNQVDNLSARGRFLALWNCSTGLAQSNPPESPYLYKSGDYFIVGTVGTTNYKPTGSSYTTGVASTVVETAEVSVDDVYYYDGTQWRLQVNTQKTLAFVNIAGDPYDNTNLASALNAKQDELPSQTGQSGKFLTTNGTAISWGDVTFPVTDVQVKGTSVVTNGVANIGTAGDSSYGVVKTNSTTYGVGANADGIIFLRAATTAQIDAKTTSFFPVMPSNLDYAVKVGITTNTQTLTATEKGNACDWLGAVKDVQMKDTSIVSNGVANIPQSTTNSLGVVRIGSGLAIQAGNGSIYIVGATESNLVNKLNSSNPVVSTNLDMAIREGLGNNSLTWTDAYKVSACKTIGTISGVQVNSTDLTPDTTTNKVNIEKASNDGTVVGVVQLSNTYGSQTVNGYLAAVDRSYAGFVGAQSTSIASVGGVKAYVGGMSVAYNASQSLTDAQKEQARTNIGAQVAGNYEQAMTIQTLSATDSITVADNTIYNGSEQTALTITLPATVDVSFLCEIDFTSGTTATTLTYSNTIKWAGDDVNNNIFLPVASKRYTIICAYDGVNWRFTVKGVE